jgi:SAM-dependent methyltransferase
LLRVSNRAEVEAMIRKHCDWSVLDIGSGDNPFLLSTVLMDRLPRQAQTARGLKAENPTGTVVQSGRPIVIGELETIPFHDQSFDFVYASHVLEHVSDPSQALYELSRVSKRGYIECPRAWFEFIDHSPFHNWLIDLADGQLLFRPKTQVETEYASIRRIHDFDPTLFSRLYGHVFTHQGGRDPTGTSIEKSICHICIYSEDDIPYQLLPSYTYA